MSKYDWIGLIVFLSFIFAPFIVFGFINYIDERTKKTTKIKIEPSYGFINHWEQSKLEVERLSREFMEELADAINKEVERQIKERNKPDFSKMTTREILEYTYKNEVQDEH